MTDATLLDAADEVHVLKGLCRVLEMAISDDDSENCEALSQLLWEISNKLSGLGRLIEAAHSGGSKSAGSGGQGL